MVRDGRDVALSAFQQPLSGIKNIYKAANDWKDNMRLVREFLATLPPHQCLEIRYEDLLSDPYEVFAQLIRFLEIDDTDGALLAFIKGHIGNDLTMGNFGKWKQQFTESQQVLYEQIACDMLEAYAYETKVQVVKQFGMLKRVGWHLDDNLKQWSFPEYWGHNLYRAKLRLRDLTVPIRSLGAK